MLLQLNYMQQILLPTLLNTYFSVKYFVYLRFKYQQNTGATSIVILDSHTRSFLQN